MRLLSSFILILAILQITSLPTTQQLLTLESGQIQYIIITSTLNSSNNSIFNQLNSETKQYLDAKFQNSLSKTISPSSRDYDRYIIDETFKRFYNWNKTLDLVIDQKHVISKAKILQELKVRFSDNKYSATMLYYSGSSDPLYGGWIISQEEKWNKIITYKDVSKLWKGRINRKSLQQLHIVIESDYSQYWVEKCYNAVEFDDISVQAAALKNESAQNIQYGGLFTYNFAEVVLNFRNQTFIKSGIENQHTIGVGFQIFLEKIFGVGVYFQSWKELFQSRLIPF